MKKIKKREKSPGTEGEKKNEKKKSRLLPVLAGIIFAAAVTVLIVIMYINSGYKRLHGSFGYSLEYNSRKYEFKTSKQSLDVFQIKDLASAKTDCYVYVGTYDPEQNLQETLDIINSETGTNYSFMQTKVGEMDYPAIFVDYKTEKGGNFYIYYIEWQGHHFIIQTLADDEHQEEIDRMVKSFRIG